MAIVRKLNADEIKAIEESERKTANKGVRANTRREYDELVAGFSEGEMIEVSINDGEKFLTVKGNVKAAIERRNLVATPLRAPRGKGKELVRFRLDPAGTVVTEDNSAE